MSISKLMLVQLKFHAEVLTASTFLGISEQSQVARCPT